MIQFPILKINTHVNTIRKRYSDLPIILTGTFNVYDRSIRRAVAAAAYLGESEGLSSAYATTVITRVIGCGGGGRGGGRAGGCGGGGCRR